MTFSLTSYVYVWFQRQKSSHGRIARFIRLRLISW